MGISFLAPVFLLGAAALAVPIIIHLVHRQKPEGTAFPSLMFLRQIPYKAQRRQKIRHWFLFLTRCLAMILIAVAFARPLFQGADIAGAVTTGGRDLVVAVDRSFSMGYGGRWEQAVDAARRVIDGVGPEDRASLVMFDHQATAVSQPTSDRAALLATLGRQELGSGMTDYSVALRLAQQILVDSDLPHREIVVISDFQRTGQDGQDEVRFAEGIRLTPVDLSTPEASNVAVASVSLSQRPRGGREEVLVSARVVHWGGAGEVSTTVRLELNGQQLLSQSLQLAPGQSETVVFEPVLVPVGTSRGIVRVDDPKLASDNAFNFVLTPGRALSVLVLESTNARQHQSLFLARALGVGDRPAFTVDVKPISAFRLTDLEDRSLVVMNDTPFPEGNAGQQILNFVNGGGGLLVVLGERADRGWTAPIANATGATLGNRVERMSGRGAAVTQLEYSHPVFDVFNAPRSGDFSSAQIYRYRGLVLQDQMGVLARFDDGGPAIVERRIGEGRVLVLTTTLDTYWNDLALQPVFLPFVHQTAKYLTRYREASPWFTVGDVVDLAPYLEQVDGSAEVLGAMADNREILVEAPSGERERRTGGDVLVEVREGGFHDVQPAGVHSDPAVPLAVNVSAAESDLSVLDVEEFLSAVSGGSGDGLGPEMSGPVSAADYEKRQRLWWYLLAGAIAVLGVETVVSNRLSKAVR